MMSRLRDNKQIRELLHNCSQIRTLANDKKKLYPYRLKPLLYFARLQRAYLTQDARFRPILFYYLNFIWKRCDADPFFFLVYIYDRYAVPFTLLTVYKSGRPVLVPVPNPYFKLVFALITSDFKAIKSRFKSSIYARAIDIPFDFYATKAQLEQYYSTAIINRRRRRRASRRRIRFRWRW